MAFVFLIRLQVARKTKNLQSWTIFHLAVEECKSTHSLHMTLASFSSFCFVLTFNISQIYNNKYWIATTYIQYISYTVNFALTFS